MAIVKHLTLTSVVFEFSKHTKQYVKIGFNFNKCCI